MSLRVMDAVGLIGQFVADHWESINGPQDLMDELLHQGFSSGEIKGAFKWIESHTLGHPGKISDGAPPRRPSSHLLPSLRIMTSYEKIRFSPAGQGYLMSLHEKGLLDLLQVEEVIEKALRSSSDTVGIRELKSLAALVLFTKIQSDARDLLLSKSSLVQ